MELNALRDLQLEIEHSHDFLVQRTDYQEKTIRDLKVERDSLQDELTEMARNFDENIEVHHYNVCYSNRNHAFTYYKLISKHYLYL